MFLLRLKLKEKYLLLLSYLSISFLLKDMFINTMFTGKLCNELFTG
jgi:hypothetical protein